MTIFLSLFQFNLLYCLECDLFTWSLFSWSLFYCNSFNKLLHLDWFYTIGDFEEYWLVAIFPKSLSGSDRCLTFYLTKNQQLNSIYLDKKIAFSLDNFIHFFLLKAENFVKFLDLLPKAVPTLKNKPFRLFIDCIKSFALLWIRLNLNVLGWNSF